MFHNFPAEDKPRKIIWKCASPFASGSIEIGGVRVPGEELRKHEGTKDVPPGVPVLVFQMEVRFEEI